VLILQQQHSTIMNHNIKRSTLLTMTLLLHAALWATGSIRPGQLWPDTQGQHINAHGGGVLIYQNKYYWFGEYKSDNTSSALVGVTCYSSSDLVQGATAASPRR
jgi:hypothetical protein